MRAGSFETRALREVTIYVAFKTVCVDRKTQNTSVSRYLHVCTTIIYYIYIRALFANSSHWHCFLCARTHSSDSSRIQYGTSRVQSKTFSSPASFVEYYYFISCACVIIENSNEKKENICASRKLMRMCSFFVYEFNYKLFFFIDRFEKNLLFVIRIWPYPPKKKKKGVWVRRTVYRTYYNT